MSYEKSARFYDLFDRKGNIEFFFCYASRAGEALDIGAGTGRIAIPLAERGVNVFCVEPSPAMREQLKLKLAAKPELSDRIQIIPGDAASFRLNRVFPTAFLSGSFDHLLGEGQQVAALENISRHLSPGGAGEVQGCLVFDVFLSLMGDRPLSPAGEAQVGDTTVRRLVGTKVLSPQKQQVELIYEVYRNGEVVECINECGLVGITDRLNLHRILNAAGFEVKREWGGYNFRSYKAGDALLIIEAEKRRRAKRTWPTSLWSQT